MSKNKYANIVNRKNHSLVVSKPPKITKVLEGQALDGFSVEKEDTEYYLQRMANVFILPTKRRYKTSQMIKVQARMDFPTKAKKCIQAQSLENFLIERQETLLTLIDKSKQYKNNRSRKRCRWKKFSYISIHKLPSFNRA